MCFVQGFLSLQVSLVGFSVLSCHRLTLSLLTSLLGQGAINVSRVLCHFPMADGIVDSVASLSGIAVLAVA